MNNKTINEESKDTPKNDNKSSCGIDSLAVRRPREEVIKSSEQNYTKNKE